MTSFRSICASLIFVLCLSFSFRSSSQIAGEWTRCIGRLPGQQWNIVHGQASEQVCVELGKICLNDSRYSITYYSSSVIINAPYTRCTTTLSQNDPNRPSEAKPRTPPKPDPRIEEGKILYEKYALMRDGILAGNVRQVKAYLDTGEYNPTTYIYSDKYDWTKRYTNYWVPVITRSPSPFSMMQVFINAGLNISAEGQWRFDAFRNKTSQRKDELLKTFDFLTQRGLRPLTDRSPGKPRHQEGLQLWSAVENQLIDSCHVWPTNADVQWGSPLPDPAFALQLFDVHVKNFEGRLLANALASRQRRRGSSSTPDYIRSMYASHSRSPSTQAYWEACLPLADRIDAFLKLNPPR